MSPERPDKGLWGRVKEALGVTRADDEDLAAAPRVSTFTAHRFPSWGSPLSGPLFPPEDHREGKWELYEDGWKQTDVARHDRPRPVVDRDGWEQPDDEPEELSAALQALVTDGDPTGLLAHVDDEQAEALAQTFGLDELPPPGRRDTGTERQVEVHEDRVSQANARSRRAPRPGVNVHDAHLERPAGPVTLTPSEAMALAERGRDAIGRRRDVGPAS